MISVLIFSLLSDRCRCKVIIWLISNHNSSILYLASKLNYSLNPSLTTSTCRTHYTPLRTLFTVIHQISSFQQKRKKEKENCIVIALEWQPNQWPAIYFVPSTRFIQSYTVLNFYEFPFEKQSNSIVCKMNTQLSANSLPYLCRVTPQYEHWSFPAQLLRPTIIFDWPFQICFLR